MLCVIVNQNIFALTVTLDWFANKDMQI